MESRLARDLHRQCLVSPFSRAPDRTATAIGVMFGPGARTYWHSHPDGQVLYVATGAGRVGSADGEVAANWLPATSSIRRPGESHWHGANPTSFMMHVSVTTGGATVWEPRAVTDDEYNAG